MNDPLIQPMNSEKKHTSMIKEEDNEYPLQPNTRLQPSSNLTNIHEKIKIESGEPSMLYGNNRIITNLCIPNSSDSFKKECLDERESEQKVKKQSLISRVILKDKESIDLYALCKLCQSIYDNPVSCSNCNDFFCLQCISSYSKKNNGLCKCGQPLKISKAHKILHTLLDKYSFRCVKFASGCNASIPYKELHQHELYCDYREIKCGHPPCKKMIFYKDYKVHIARCEFQEIACKYCQVRGIKREIELHQKDCDQKLTFCKACNQYFILKEMKRHQKKCSEILESCPKCKVELKRKDLMNHTELDCIEALYTMTKDKMIAEIHDLKNIILQMNTQVERQENYFGIRCIKCNKFACEVSRKNCNQCLKHFCIPCSKRNIKNCKGCDSQVCLECFKSNDFCEMCIKRSRKNKYDYRNGRNDKSMIKNYGYVRNNGMYSDTSRRIESIE